MKVVISACVFAAVVMVAGGAPALSEGELPQQAPVPVQLEHFRQKRSSYPNQYLSTCSGASLPISGIAPASAYQLNLGHGGYGQQAYGYGGVPHYRSEMGDEHEMMSFSDADTFMHEHIPSARYGYGAAAAAPVHYGGGGPALGAYGGLVAPVAAGPAYGVFPNANVGGCSVPLLLSCSPRIVPGQLVKSQASHGYGGAALLPAAAPEGYRGVDDHHESHDHAESQQTHEHIKTHEGE